VVCRHNLISNENSNKVGKEERSTGVIREAGGRKKVMCGRGRGESIVVASGWGAG